MNFPTTSGNEPIVPDIYTKNLVLSGIPVEVTESLVIGLLGMHGIGHNVHNRDQFAHTDTLETGDPNIDERNLNEVMVFRMFLDSLNTYNEVHCRVQTTGIGLFLTFTCR